MLFRSWVYTRNQDEQAFLGTFSADEDGVLSEDIRMRVVDVTGPVDLVISGTDTSGQRVSIGVPTRIVRAARSSGFGDSLLAGLLFAVGCLFMYPVFRRRSGVAGILRNHR